jgi:hypothetical protein
MIGDQRLAAPSTPRLSECALPLSYASLYRLSDERFGMPDDLPYSKNEKWFLPSLPLLHLLSLLAGKHSFPPFQLLE